jgi:hypothetical protein
MDFSVAGKLYALAARLPAGPTSFWFKELAAMRQLARGRSRRAPATSDGRADADATAEIEARVD